MAHDKAESLAGKQATTKSKKLKDLQIFAYCIQNAYFIFKDW